MGFRAHTTRHFCFGKSAQNHFRPCAALQRMAKKPAILLRVPPPPHRIRWLRNSLRSNSLCQKVDSVLQLRRTRRRGDVQETNQAFKLRDGESETYYNSILIPDTKFFYELTGSYTETYKIPDNDGQRVEKPQRLSTTKGSAVYCLTISKGLYCRANEMGSYSEPDNP